MATSKTSKFTSEVRKAREDVVTKMIEHYMNKIATFTLRIHLEHLELQQTYACSTVHSNRILWYSQYIIVVTWYHKGGLKYTEDGCQILPRICMLRKTLKIGYK